MKKDLAIMAFKCKNCDKIHYPYHDRCLACRHREFEEIKPSGNAKLLTYTAIFNLPWGFDQRFLIIGVAEFENQVKAMGQIKVDSVDQLKVGMKVKTSWEPIREQYSEDVYGLKFEPIE
jgi:uncharacterized OB-fold protein